MYNFIIKLPVKSKKIEILFIKDKNYIIKHIATNHMII